MGSKTLEFYSPFPQRYQRSFDANLLQTLAHHILMIGSVVTSASAISGMLDASFGCAGRATLAWIAGALSTCSTSTATLAVLVARAPGSTLATVWHFDLVLYSSFA